MAVHSPPKMSLQVLGMGGICDEKWQDSGRTQSPASQLGVRYSGVSGARDFGGNLVFRNHGIRYVAWA